MGCPCYETELPVISVKQWWNDNVEISGMRSGTISVAHKSTRTMSLPRKQHK